MTPADAASRLATAATELQLSLSAKQIEQLLAYARLLHRWNGTYNLTALREPDQILSHHLVDCLAIVNPLRARLPGRRGRILDVGSGGGLPGVVLAVLDPEIAVTCVDAVGKKAAFVQQVQVELKLANLVSLHARAEGLPRGRHVYQVLISRAFASLSDFVDCTRGLLAADGIWMAMKGKDPRAEVAAIPSDIDVFHVERLHVPDVGAERHLVWMRSLS